MRIEIHSRLVEKELERLEDGPGIRDLIRLEAVLAAQFSATQARVHIDTGSLRRSGRQVSSMNRVTDVWEGKITYGGPSMPNNPVKYAPHEWARGGSHDFLQPARKFERRYEQEIINFFRGKGKR